MTAETRRQIREREAKGDYSGAAKLRVKAALGEASQPATKESKSDSFEHPTTFPASRVQAIGQELLKLSNNVQRDLARAQTLLGEMRGIAYALEEKR